MASFYTCECCGHEHDTRLSHRCHPLDVAKVNKELRSQLAAVTRERDEARRELSEVMASISRWVAKRIGTAP